MVWTCTHLFFHTFMRKQCSLLWGGLLLTGIALPACQREIAVAPTSAVVGKSNGQDIQAHYPGFDWDNPSTTTMPVAANSPVVYVPWRSNGGTPLDPGIVDDYHKSDGWELVYNSFAPDNFPTAGTAGVMATSSGQPAGGLYFALYNRYRGILRYYLYIPPGLFGSSTQISHGLGIYTTGNTSKMLNFEGVDIVDPSNNSTGFTKTNKDGVSVTGGWYAMQYQLAYDPAFANTSYPNPGFSWNSRSVSITQIYSEGVEIGSLKGTIVTPKPDFNWATAALGVVEAVGTATLDPASNIKIVAGLAGAASGGLSGSAQGVLDGVFGSASSQTVDLSLSSNITTNGTATTFQPYELNAMPFPGQNLGTTNGVPPLITHPLGLFNLSDRPTVYVHSVRTAVTGPSGSGYRYDYTYSFDAAALQLLIQKNPSILNTDPSGASVSNFKAEVVSVDPNADDYPGFQAYGTQELVGTHTVYTGNAVTLSYSVVHGGQPSPTAQKTAIRVSFNVAPNSGASTPKPFIVRTFLANVVAR
jgi:hypothetical protein